MLYVYFIIPLVSGFEYLSAIVHSQDVPSLPLRKLWHPHMYLARESSGDHYEVRHSSQYYDVSISFMQTKDDSDSPGVMNCECRFVMEEIQEEEEETTFLQVMNPSRAKIQLPEAREKEISIGSFIPRDKERVEKESDSFGYYKKDKKYREEASEKEKHEGRQIKVEQSEEKYKRSERESKALYRNNEELYRDKEKEGQEYRDEKQKSEGYRSEETARDEYREKYREQYNENENHRESYQEDYEKYIESYEEDENYREHSKNQHPREKIEDREIRGRSRHENSETRYPDDEPISIDHSSNSEPEYRENYKKPSQDDYARERYENPRTEYRSVPKEELYDPAEYIYDDIRGVYEKRQDSRDRSFYENEHRSKEGTYEKPSGYNEPSVEDYARVYPDNRTPQFVYVYPYQGS